MNLSIVPFTAKHEAAFDAFVHASRNGTIFHTRKFLAYHPEDRFHDASLCFFDGEILVGVLPAAKRDIDGKNILVAHPGASYGGLVVAPDTSATDMLAMLHALLEYATSHKYDGIRMLRLAPSSLQRAFSEDQHYALMQLGFRLTASELDGAVDLRGMKEDDVLPSVTGKCRNMVRQAERANITVKFSTDFAAFWPILEGVLGGRHGVKPTHTLAEFQKLHGLLPENFRLLAAFQEKKMIGGIVLVTIHDKALYTLYMAQDYAAQKDHPMHALLAEAMKIAIREKRNVLHLGVSTEDGGKKVNEGLLFFKESFGCRPMRRESFELLL